MVFAANPFSKETKATLNFLEKTLSKQTYVHGDRLTSLDKEYFEKLQADSHKLSA